MASSLNALKCSRQTVLYLPGNLQGRMSDRASSFLIGVLGEDGANAFKKALSNGGSLQSAVVPRAIISWLDQAMVHESYSGTIPGLTQPLEFRKSEKGYTGTIGIGEARYTFKNATSYHVAAGIAVALGLEKTRIDSQTRDVTLQRLGKSIDVLVKARSASTRLEDEKLAKRVLDPTSGYQIHHEYAPEIAGSGPLLRVKVTSPQGATVGHALFTHQGPHLQPASVGVEEEHQRRGIASAMYSHAQKVTGRKLIPSTMQTDEGAALWHGNNAAPQFGGQPGMAKVEGPGSANKPTAQQAAQAPAAPQFQTQQPKPPGPKTARISKSEALVKCDMCRRPQFQDGSFVGCFCFRDMAAGVSIIKSDSGSYTLGFDAEWDSDAILALRQAMRPK